MSILSSLSAFSPSALATKLVVYLVIGAALFGAGCFLGYSFEHRAYQAYVSSQAVLAQKETDAAKAVVQHDKEVQSAIDAQNQKDLAGYAGYVAQLLRNKPRPHQVPAAPTGAGNADVAADGCTTSAADRLLQRPDSVADADASDHVTVDALIQLQRWRSYARGTGQAK